MTGFAATHTGSLTPSSDPWTFVGTVTWQSDIDPAILPDNEPVVLRLAFTTLSSGATIARAADGRVTINSSSNGSTATVAKINGASAGGDYMVIQDSTATPTNHWFAGTHSTLVSNTSGWSLADPPPYVPPEVTMLW